MSDARQQAKQALEQIKSTENPEGFPLLLRNLEQALSSVPLSDPSHMDVLLETGEALTDKGQYQDAEKLLQRAFDAAEQSKLKGRQALALGLQADIFRAQGNYRSALSKLTAARAMIGQNPREDKDVSARLYILSGLNNMSIGDYDSARSDFIDAYQTYAQINDLNGKAIAANRIGTIATMTAEYAEAERYLQESLKLAQELGNRRAMAGAFLNLGEVKRLQEKPLEAKPLYYEASAIFAEMGLHRGMCIAENNLGHIAVLLEDFSAAKYHYLRALECAKIAALIPDMLDTLSGLAFIFAARGQNDDAATLVTFVLQHPAHLQETEQFLEAVQKKINQQGQGNLKIPDPSQLGQIIQDTLQKIF